MPLTVAPGRVEASLMRRGKAMANTAEFVCIGRPHRGWDVPVGTVAPLAAVGGPIQAFHAADRRDDVVLSRNEVMQEALGGRTWFGGLSNAGEAALADVSVHVRFHDRDGRPVGAPLSARAAGLAPGAVLPLQARLPAGAAVLRIHALRWTGAGRRDEPGPSAPLAFGVPPDRASHRAGLLPRRRTG